MRMLGYTGVLVVLATLLVMLLFAALPGGEQLLLGRNADALGRAAARDALGLDQGFVTRWWQWVQAMLSGDLGRSWMNGEPVMRILQERLPVSVWLVVPGYALGALVAWWLVPLQLLEGRHWPGGVAFGGLVLGSTVLAVLAHLIVRAWPWWPLGGLPLQPWSALALHGFWPTLVIGWSSYACSYWHFRSQAATLEDTALRGCRARNEPGGPRAAVRRMLWAALLTRGLYGLPVVMVGAVVVETAFAVPGVASRLVTAMLAGDQPVILGITLVMAVWYGVLRLLLVSLLLRIDRRSLHG